jgi:DNA topoisomerase-1
MKKLSLIENQESSTMDYFYSLATIRNRATSESLSSLISTVIAQEKAPLYVSRPIVNAKKILKWFRKQGLEQTVKPDALHITICYSTKAVNWNKFQPNKKTITLNHTKGRKVAKLGDYVVQKIKCKRLETLHNRFIDGGCSWDFPSYVPHISVLKDDHNNIEYKSIKSYPGKIVFGPEKFEPIKDSKASLVFASDYKFLAKDIEFESTDHPRAKDGEFAKKGGGTSDTPKTKTTPLKEHHVETKLVDGKRVQADGKPLPEHVEKLKIPPAWKDVTVNTNANGSLLATGKDSKNRPVSIYSLAFQQKQAEAKFARIEKLAKSMGSIRSKNNAAMESDRPKVKSAADCTHLIMEMGIRPGSDSDTGAKVKAYGATNMLGKHVVVDGDKVNLKFTGKKGVNIDLPVTDKHIAAMLKERKEKAGEDGKIFGDLNEKTLLAHVHSISNGRFKTKDFRTHLATKTAAELVKKATPPTNEKEYKKSVMDIAKKVSTKLGNSPVMALNSYIAPEIFGAWRASAGV